MKHLFKDLWLAVLLIVIASGILLLSDTHQRQRRFDAMDAGYSPDSSTQVFPSSKGLHNHEDSHGHKELVSLDFAEWAKRESVPEAALLEKADRILNLSVRYGRPARIAIITLVENRLLEEAEEGLVIALNESGLIPMKDYVLKKYSAQGEMAQLPQIIDAAVSERPDAIVTITTPALIAIAKKSNKIPVVFTVASDPVKLDLFKSGIPKNICGVHDNPPVDILLDMAMRYDKTLTSVGIVYDAAQMNSLLSVRKLRKAGEDRQIKVVEATASSVTELGMATQSLVQRGVQAIIISADNLANTGFSSIYKAAKAAGIPIYATEPSLVDQGARAAYGDSFIEWGRQSGRMLVKVLAGLPPSDLGFVETEVQQLVESETLTANKHSKRPFNLRLVLYSETEFAERCRDGLLDGIKEAGLIQGKDFNLKTYNAQGDMSILSSIMNNVKSDRVDLLLAISTPTLQAALRQAGKDTKIVFTGVGDGVKAGAGRSETQHLPHVTGVTTRSSFDGMAKIIRQTLPKAKRVGTLFTPAEINSQIYKELFEIELNKLGLELVAIPITSSADIAQTATELCSKDIHVLCQVVDNLTRPGFALISRKAAEKNVPVFVFDSDQMKDGGTLCLARDYYSAGLEAAVLAVKILHGQDPATIPFRNTQSEKLIIHPDLAKKHGLQNLEALLNKASHYPSGK